MKIGRLWSLNDRRQITETRFVDDVPKCSAADFALPDTGVPVNTRTQCRPGVIQVAGQHLIEPDERIEFGKDCVPLLPSSQVITRRKEMCRVQAKPKA